MKILHILHEFPFPQTSGVRCDIGRRLQGFAELGHEVFAISWYSVGAGERPSERELRRMETVTSHHVLLPIAKNLASQARRVARLGKYPSYVASRIPSPEAVAELDQQVNAFGPDMIWLEGVHPAWLALHFAERLGIPLVYRAHNVEHFYLAEQARLTSSWKRKLALRAGILGLRRIEEDLREKASSVFDISSDDLRWWQDQGFSGGDTLMTQAEPDFAAARAVAEDANLVDLLYFGGLSSPNNIAGLTWFFDEVLPHIRERRPDVAVLVAGRDPDMTFARRMTAEGIELVASPPSIGPLLARARVVINPILHGSGVNVKTIDMLSSGLPMVTTSKGARGLDEDVRQFMVVADNPSDFARECLRAIDQINDPRDADRSAETLDRHFGLGALADALIKASGGGIC